MALDARQRGPGTGREGKFSSGFVSSRGPAGPVGRYAAAVRWIGRGVLFGLAAVSVLGVAGCGGGQGVHSSVGMLATIPDSAANRQLIVDNQPAVVAHQFGIKPDYRGHPSHSSLDAMGSELSYGSPAGSEILSTPTYNPRRIGYDPLTIREEVAVGFGEREITGLRLPGSTAGVASHLERAGFHRVGRVDGFTTLNSSHAALSDELMPGVKTIALSNVQLATGGSKVPAASLGALLSGRTAKRPLTDDPAVAAFLSLFRGDPAQVMGTSLALSPVEAVGGNAATPQQVREILERFHLDKLRSGPTFAGFAYLPGSSSRLRVVAAARYATAGEAATGASVLGLALRTGTSIVRNVPYSKLWTVDSLARHGNTVVAHLTLRQSTYLVNAVGNGDFPLFWSPPRHAH